MTEPEKRKEGTAPRSFVDELIQGLESEGVKASEGEFTMDREVAREKMRRFQLADPDRYLVEWIQAAVVKGATRIDVNVDADDVVLTFDGRPFTLADLELMYNALFTARNEPDFRARQQLALGLNAVLGKKIRFVRLLSGKGEDQVVLDARPGQKESFARSEKPEPLDDKVVTRIHVKLAIGASTVGRSLEQLTGSESEWWLLRNSCRWADTEIRVNDSLVSLGQRYLECAVEVDIAKEGIRGKVAIGPGSGDDIHILKDGVVIATEKHDRLTHHFLMVVEGDRLHKDLSQAKIVQDEAYEEVKKAVDEAGFRAIRKLADETIGGSHPPFSRTWGYWTLKGLTPGFVTPESFRRALSAPRLDPVDIADEPSDEQKPRKAISTLLCRLPLWSEVSEDGRILSRLSLTEVHEKLTSKEGDGKEIHIALPGPLSKGMFEKLFKEHQSRLHLTTPEPQGDGRPDEFDDYPYRSDRVYTSLFSGELSVTGCRTIEGLEEHGFRSGAYEQSSWFLLPVLLFVGILLPFLLMYYTRIGVDMDPMLVPVLYPIYWALVYAASAAAKGILPRLNPVSLYHVLFGRGAKRGRWELPYQLVTRIARETSSGYVHFRHDDEMNNWALAEKSKEGDRVGLMVAVDRRGRTLRKADLTIWQERTAQDAEPMDLMGLGTGPSSFEDPQDPRRYRLSLSFTPKEPKPENNVLFAELVAMGLTAHWSGPNRWPDEALSGQAPVRWAAEPETRVTGAETFQSASLYPRIKTSRDTGGESLHTRWQTFRALRFWGWRVGLIAAVVAVPLFMPQPLHIRFVIVEALLFALAAVLANNNPAARAAFPHTKPLRPKKAPSPLLRLVHDKGKLYIEPFDTHAIDLEKPFDLTVGRNRVKEPEIDLVVLTLSQVDEDSDRRTWMTFGAPADLGDRSAGLPSFLSPSLVMAPDDLRSLVFLLAEAAERKGKPLEWRIE